jgi:hypothetical protein
MSLNVNSLNSLGVVFGVISLINLNIINQIYLKGFMGCPITNVVLIKLFMI